MCNNIIMMVIFYKDLVLIGDYADGLLFSVQSWIRS